MKKIVAIALALVMMLSCAVFASAAQTTQPDITFGGWWSAHSQGVQITEEGFTMTFFTDTDDGAAANYCTPSLVIHAGSADTLGTEYWVQRADAWGWLYGENVGDHAAALNAKGYSWNYTFEESFGSWENFQAVTEAGTEATVTAKLQGSNALITYRVAGVVNEVTVPVDAANPVFLCLTGERCAVSNITVTTPDPEPEPEPEPEPAPSLDLTAMLKFADADFVPATAGVCPTTITGAGTYTLSVEDITATFGAPLDYAYMLYVEVEGGYESLKDMLVTDVKIVVDGEEIAVDQGKVWTYQSVGADFLPNGNYCIEIANFLAGISIEYGACIDPAIYADESVSVTFTLVDPNAPVDPDPNQPTGDAIFAVLAIFSASGMGLTAVASKKK